MTSLDILALRDRSPVNQGDRMLVTYDTPLARATGTSYVDRPAEAGYVYYNGFVWALFDDATADVVRWDQVTRVPEPGE